MINIAGIEYRTLNQNLYVNGKKVQRVYANDQLVYPDSIVVLNGGITRLKARGPIPSQNNRIYTAEHEYELPQGVYIAYVKQFLFAPSSSLSSCFAITRYIIWPYDGIERTIISRKTTQWEGAEPQYTESSFIVNHPLYSTIEGYAYQYGGTSYSNPEDYEYIEVEGVDLFGTFDSNVSNATIARLIINEIIGG